MWLVPCCRRGFRGARIGAALVLLLLCLLWKRSDALRHSFRTQNDPRTVIGPVGVPFGFLAGGEYELNVYDFELTTATATAASLSNNKNKRAAGTEEDPDGATSANPFPGLNPGFYLHRFANDAAYTKYLNTLRSNASACSFEYFLDHDDDKHEALNDDTVMYEEVGEVTSSKNGILLMMRPRRTKWKPAPTSTIRYQFPSNNVDEEGLYFLTYQICVSGDRHLPDLKRVHSSFELDFQFRNIDPVTGTPTYLTAGELHLPFLFFFFSVSYLILSLLWIANLRAIHTGGPGLFDERNNNHNNTHIPVVYPIHKLMAALLGVKFLAVFFESLRYHAIRITGHAELWSAVYYTISFVKGVFLFTVILLIGSGWSFVKPFLNQAEKRVILCILILQVLNNLAIAVLSHETAGERNFDLWNAILHLVDIMCCCAVLLPIVWQVNALEKSLPKKNKQKQQQQQLLNNKKHNFKDIKLDEHDDLPEDELENDDKSSYDDDDDEEMDYHEYDTEQDREKGHILSKLKLFRSFYLLVVTYIYMTRIIVYLFATLLDYRHLWVRYAMIELITLTFYVTVGILFRPMKENPYLSLSRRDKDDDSRHGELEESSGIDLVPTRKKEPVAAVSTTTTTTKSWTKK